MKKIKFGIIALLLGTFLVSCSAINTHEHSFEVTKIDPTCTQKGQIIMVCKSCGYTNTLDIDPTGHQGPISYDADYHWKTCNTCNQTYDKESHKLSNDVCDCGYVRYSTGLTYSLYYDHVEVTGIGTCLDSNIIISPTYHGFPVTCISFYAFEDCDFITNVILPDTITILRNDCFKNCSSLVSIFIPKRIISIGHYAFNGCTSLANVAVDEDNVVYDSRNNCNAIIETETNNLILGCKNTIIPDSVTNIGGQFVSSPKNIVIPKTVTTIISNPFAGCSNIETITVEKENPVFDSRDNCNAIVMTSENKIVASCKNTVIKDSINIIGQSSFAYSTFESICIPNSVTNIESGAFKYSAFLISVDLPNSFEIINSSTFEGCLSLTSIIIPDSVYVIYDYAFKDCSSLTSVVWLGNYLKAALYSTFDGCSSLTSFTIYSPFINFHQRMFESTSVICTQYDNGLYLGNSSNPYLVFYKPISQYITSCKINNNCKGINYAAFSYCYDLKEVYIPLSVDYILRNTFNNRLTNATIYCEADTKPEGWDVDWVYEWYEHTLVNIVWGYVAS